MKGLAHILIAVIIVVALGIILVLPSGQTNSTGLVLLMQNKETIDSYFTDGKLNQNILDEINKNAENVPEQLFSLFGNNKINMYVEFEDGSVNEYWAQTEKNKVTEVRQGARSLADIEIKIKETTINKLALSEEPFDEFLDAMNSGEIEYKGLTFEGTIKSATVSVTTTLVGIAKGIADFFSGIFG